MSSEPSLLESETVVLRDPSSSARAVVAPARGGMVTRFEVGGRRALYLDEATLADPSKNVRGGSPVLFPSPGPLAGGRFERGGKSGAMGQHGFARTRPWTVIDSDDTEVELELVSDDATRAMFPWDFVARIRYLLDGSRLTVATSLTNRSSDPMPFALGFHPYFAVSDGSKRATRVPTRATRGWDNVQKSVVDVKGPIDLTAGEVDLHLFDHGSDRAVIERADGTRIVVTAEPAFVRWVVWTVAGKDYVCLEPWTAPADALNTGENLLVLAPGASRTLVMSMALELP